MFRSLKLIKLRVLQVNTSAYPSIINNIRSFTSSESPASMSWDKMTSTQRDAWILLGWNETSWKGQSPAPPSDSAYWKQLTPTQQSAAKYGLGYTSHVWDMELDGIEEHSDSNIVSTDKVNNEVSSSNNKKTGGILSSIFNVIKGGSDVINTGFDIANDPIAGIQDSISNKIDISSIESIVYLDDSGSMQGSNIQHAKEAFNSIFPLFRTIPTRIVLFGSNKTELFDKRQEEISSKSKNVPSTLITNQWNGHSGGTYMWHMIGTSFDFF